MKWYLKAFKHYSDFEGRARRTEYWMFVLFNTIFTLVAIALDNILGITLQGTPYGLLYLLYALIVFIPSLALAIRRLHDVGKSGWMVLISLIPIIGGIWLLVLMVTDSQPGENEYGPNPKEVGDDYVPTKSEDNVVIGKNSDSIILIIVIWMLFTRLFWLLLPKIADDFFSADWYVGVSTFFNVIWSFVPLILAFTIRDKDKRTIVLIIGAIYILVNLYGVLERFL